MNDQEQPYNGQIDEPLLTAYALGQLEGPEHALVEAALKTDHKAQSAVEEIRAMAGHLRDALSHDREYAPSAPLRAMIEQRLEGTAPAVVHEEAAPARRPRRRWAYAAVASAAAILLAVTIPSLPMFRSGTPSNVAMDTAPPMKSAAPAAEMASASEALPAPEAFSAMGDREEVDQLAEMEEPVSEAGEFFDHSAVKSGEVAGKDADPYRSAFMAEKKAPAKPAPRMIGKAGSAPAAPTEPAERPVAKGSSAHRYNKRVVGGTFQFQGETQPTDLPVAVVPQTAPSRAAVPSAMVKQEVEGGGAALGASVQGKAARQAKPTAPTPPPTAWSHQQAAGPGAIPVPYPATAPGSAGQMPWKESEAMPRAKSAGGMGGQGMMPSLNTTPPVADYAPPAPTPPVAAKPAANKRGPVSGRYRYAEEAVEVQGQMGRQNAAGFPAQVPVEGQQVQSDEGRQQAPPSNYGYRRAVEDAYGPAGEDARGRRMDRSSGGVQAEVSPSDGQGLPGAAQIGMQRVQFGGGVRGLGGMAVGNEQYAPVVENSFLSPLSEPESTVAADVDTASYPNVRRYLEHNRTPPPGAVRVEEMVNYFSYDYPQPKGDTPFSVTMETASCPWNGDHRLVRIGLKAKDVDPAERGPSNLVFLLDVSGSMRDANKLPLVKDAMAMLVDQLTEDDRVSIVTYAGDAGLALKPTEGTHRQEILGAIEDLKAGGSTHGSAGIELAYEQAMANFVPKGSNRVILCTDGDLNVGITDDNELVKLIQEKATSGVFLTVVGFGTGNLKDTKLEQLADKGNGNYAYVDGLSEAEKVFVEQVSGNLVTVAKDVKIQVEFNPAKVQGYRLVGYENRMLASEDFDDDSKDAGEIGAGHAVTFLYEIAPTNLPVGQIAALNDHHGKLRYQQIMTNALTEAGKSNELLALKLRYKLPDEQESRLKEYPVLDSDKRFGEASSEFRFAAAVAAFGMLLRGSQYNQGLTFSAVEEFAAGATDDDPHGRRAEFVNLVRRAESLYGDTTQVGADAMAAPPLAQPPAASVETPMMEEQ